MNDYCYRLYSPGLYYGSVVDIRDNGGFKDLTGFASLYSITSESAKALQQEGTSARFAGCVRSERLWVDIDTKGLSEEGAVKKLDKAQAIVGELGYDYVSYDSGGHSSVGGGHFGILREAEASHLLPAKDRQWVRATFGDLADTSIYSHLHLFRLPGTVHETTGRRKTLVGGKGGKVLTLPPLDRVVASSPALGMPYTNERSVFSNFRLMSNIGPKSVGQRHFSLVKLAYELRDHGVEPDKALWMLQQNNLMFTEPKSEEEVIKIYQDIFGA